METSALLFFLLFLPAALTAPWNPWEPDYQVASSNKCSSHCTGSSKFQYAEGSTYQYKYEVDTYTNMKGAGDGAARMNIQATANIHALSKCEMALSLDNVVIKASEPGDPALKEVDSWQFKLDLERNVLRFAFQDGRVEELCPSQEFVKPLNFKRGILSAFQNSMNQHERDEDIKEVDVTGHCPTSYKVTQQGLQSVQITKEKDLLGCADRSHYKSVVRSTPFKVPDSIQSLPLLKGNHKCTQTLSTSGVLQSSVCQEALVFRPFSKADAGASTVTLQKLTLMPGTQDMLIAEDTISTRTNLLYEHTARDLGDDLTLWSTKEKLSELCRATAQAITVEAPGLFTDLVYLMRELASQEIKDIAGRVQRGNICQDNKERARKFFMDALPMIGTAASVEVMVDMLLNGDVMDSEKQAWITSFNFIHEPTLDVLTNLRRLLVSKEMREDSLLPVTSVVNNYCREDTICAGKHQVQDILTALRDIMGRDCSRGDQNLKLLALRAAGNLGHSDEISSTLERCMDSSRNPMVVRVSAAQAYRAVSCNTDRKAVMDTFMNREEDSELRINAYLSVMVCPSEVILSEVRKALETEKVNQVGSFVWTHLTNLMSTSSPHKQAIREILEDEDLKAEFNMDRRKYSRNYELSYFSEMFAVGAGAESNVIFSTKSFLPRSMMLNLTVDMLGHSVNLMEIGGRVEGLELLLKRYLGPGGMFEKTSTKDSSSSNCVSDDKMDRMKDEFGVSPEEMQASFYLKLFGNEMSFQHFTEKDLSDLKNKFSLKTILGTLARGDDINFTKSSLFLDSTVTVPTVAGMALHLSVNGSASLELIARGKLDMRHLSQKRMQAMLDVKPSGAVQLSGLMSLDSGASTAGLKMVTTLHSSTAASANLDLINGQVLTIDFDTPRERMEIMDIKSDIYLVHNERLEKHEMKMNGRIREEACPFVQITALEGLGYNLCGHISFTKPASEMTSPFYPFNGHTSFGLTLHKLDAPKGFKLFGKYIQTEDTAVGQLSFDAPASKGDRAINVGYFWDMKDKTTELELNSPWKKIIAKGTYSFAEKSRMLSVTVRDDGKEYLMVAKVDKQMEKTKVVWKPSFELSRPADSRLFQATPVKVTIGGTVNMSKKFDEMEAKITYNSGIKPDPVEINAKYVNKKRQHTLSGSVTLDTDKVYSGTLQAMTNIQTKNSVSARIEPTILISAPNWRVFLLSGQVNYKEDKMLAGNLQVNMDQTLRQPVELQWKATKQTKKSQDRIKFTTRVKSEFVTGKSRGTIQVPTPSEEGAKRGNLLTTKITTDYFIPLIQDKAKRKNKIILSSKVIDRSTSTLKKYDLSVNLDNKKDPEQNVVMNADFEHKQTYTKSMITIGYGPKARFKDKAQHITFGTSLTHKINDKMALIRYSVQFLNPQQKMEYQIEGKHEHHLNNKFWFETYQSTIFAKGKSIEFRVKGKDSSKKRDDLNLLGSLELNYPDFDIGESTVKGNSYKMSTILEKKSRDTYIHTVSLQTSETVKHSLVTNYKGSDKDFTSLTSKLQMQGEHPVVLDIGVTKDTRTVTAQADMLYKNEDYTFFARDTRNHPKHHQIDWKLDMPGKKLNGVLMGELKKDTKAVVRIETEWLYDNEPKRAIGVDLGYESVNTETKNFFDFKVKIQTPFPKNELYQFERMTDYQTRYFSDVMIIVYGNPENELSHKIKVLLPFTKESFEMKATFKTPLEQLRKLNMQVSHRLDGVQLLSTEVRGDYNDHFVNAAIKLQDNGNAVTRDLSGSVAITSSFEELKRAKVSASHTDDGSAFKSNLEGQYNRKTASITQSSRYIRVDYMLTLNSKVEVSVPDQRPLTVEILHTNTWTNLNSSFQLDWKPEYNTKMVIGAKSSQAEDEHAVEYEYTGPWNQLHHVEGWNRYKSQLGVTTMESYVRVNKDAKLTYTDLFKMSDTMLEVAYTRGDQEFKLLANYAKLPYTVDCELLMENPEQPWRKQEFTLEASVDENSKGGWTTIGKLTTPFKSARNVDLTSKIEKNGETEWTMDTAIRYAVRKQITGKFMVDVGAMRKLTGEIKTPFANMTNFNFGFDRQQKRFKDEFTGHIEMKPIFKKVKMDLSYRLKPDFHGTLFMDLPETDFKFIEIEADNSRNKKRTNTDVKIKYHPQMEISAVVKTDINPNKFPEDAKVSLDLATPYEELPTMSVAAGIDKRKGKWLGKVDLKTDSEKLEYANVIVEHFNSPTTNQNDITVESSAFETVSAGVHWDWDQEKAVSVSFDAPSVGKTDVGFKHKAQSWTNFHNRINFDINGHELDLEAGLDHSDEDTQATLTFVLPGSKYSYVKAKAHRLGESFTDFDMGGFLKVGRDSKPFNVSMQFSNVPGKFAIGTTVETPYSKALSYLLKSRTSPQDSENILFAKYSHLYLLDYKAYQALTNSTYDYRTETTTKFNGTLNHYFTEIKAKFDEEGEEAQLETQTTTDWIKANYVRNIEKSENSKEKHVLEMDMQTSYQDLPSLTLNGVVNTGSRDHNGEMVVELAAGQVATLTFDVKEENKHKTSVTSVLKLPLEGYEENTLKYNQIMRKNAFKADVEAITGKGEIVNGKLVFSKWRDLDVTLNGPIEVFDTLKINANWDESSKRVVGTSSLKLSLNPSPAKLDFDVHVDDLEPLMMTLKLQSPYKNAKKLELTMKHDGKDWDEFTTTAGFSSQEHGDLNAELDLDFSSPLRMDGKAFMASTIGDGADIQMTLKTERDGEDAPMSSKVELGWAKDKIIKINHIWGQSQRRKKTRITHEVDMTTPFPDLKTGGLKLVHSHDTDSFSESLDLFRNGEHYVDAELEYKFGEEVQQGSLEVRRPIPMLYSITGTVNENGIDTNLDINWNRQDSNSQFEVTTRLLDNSDQTKVEKIVVLMLNHPVRSLGVDSYYVNQADEFQVRGDLIWHKQTQKAVSYDLGWSNTMSRRSWAKQGHAKVGLPGRSVKVEGSMSEGSNSWSSSSALLWDADNDEDKKVEMTTTLERGQRADKLLLKMNLPSIDKELSMDVSSKKGRNLYDVDAEISYSNNPLKAIRLTSKLSNDIPSTDGHYNYTVQFGIEHPITNIDIQSTSHIGCTEEAKSMGSQVVYTAASGSEATLQLYGSMDNLNNMMEVLMVTPFKRIMVEGQLDNSERRSQVSWRSFEDGTPALKAELVLDRFRRSVDVEFNYDQGDPNKMVTLNGRLVNDSALQLDVVNYQSRSQFRTETVMAVRLNNSNLLHTRLEWRPTLMQELQAYLGARVTEFSYVSSELMEEVIKATGAEVTAKYALVSREVTSELDDMFGLVKDEMEEFSTQLRVFNRELQRAYQRNDLNIRSTGAAVTGAIEEILGHLRLLVEVSRNSTLAVSYATDKLMQDLLTYPVTQTYMATVQNFMEALKVLRATLEEVLNEVVEEAQNLSQLTYNQYSQISREINRKLQSYVINLRQLPMHRVMIQQREDLMKLGNNVIPHWAHALDKAYLVTQEVMATQFHDMMNRQEFQHLHAMINEIHQQIMYYSKDGGFDRAVQRLTDLTRNLILMEIMKVTNSLTDFQKSRFIVFDPARGEIQFEVHLPVGMKNLLEPPKLKVGQTAKTLYKWTKSALPDLNSNSSVWDLYYDYVPSLDASTWIPPFEASAYLIGSQHILTFDQQPVTFLSQCSHVLARDVLGDGFSVVVNYHRNAQRDGVRSLCLTFDNSIHLEVAADYKLEVNRQEVEMPFVTEKVQVLRENDMIRVLYAGGVEVVCQPNLQLYRVTINGWFHGQVEGLMGLYDNEPSNDMVSDSKASSVEVGRRSCSSGNIAVDPPLPPPDYALMCSQQFVDARSKFRPCFKQVDPEMFLNMCYLYMTTESEEEAVRLSTEQYRTVCQGEGVYIGALEQYSTCEDDLTIDHRDPMYQSADVVFVLEDSICNQWAKDSLGSMVSEINQALETSGKKDNRFGLQGYGDNTEDETSVRTINGQMFGEASMFLRAVETLGYHGYSHVPVIESAIEAAMQYPFRTGVAKVLIIAPCTTCRSGLFGGDLAESLRRNGFSVHVLQPQSYTLLDSANVQGNYRIYGVDNSKTFTNHVSDSSVTPMDVRGVKEFDYCSQMARATNGSIFDTVHLENVPGVQREFVKSFANRVGWDTRLPECQKCECDMTSGRTQCRLCQANSIMEDYVFPELSPDALHKVVGDLYGFEYDLKSFAE